MFHGESFGLEVLSWLATVFIFKKLQKGLVAEQKSTRVHNYIKNIAYEVGMIAHSYGVRSPRELNRSHACIVLENGTSVTLEEIYPCKTSVH